MGRYGRLILGLLLGVPLLFVGSAYGQDRKAWDPPTVRLSFTGGVGLTSPGSSLATLQRSDAAAYRGFQNLREITIGFGRKKGDVLGLTLPNLQMEVMLRNGELMSEARVRGVELYSEETYPFLTPQTSFFAFASAGVAHAGNKYTSLPAGESYGKATAWGIGGGFGFGARYLLDEYIEFELKTGFRGAYLFKWKGDERVINPDAYTHKKGNNYALFYGAFSFNIVF